MTIMTLVPTVLALALVAPPDVEITDANFEAWHAHVSPSEDELAWATIPWHDTFADGLLAASDAGKPLLFWAMNGHPMGCT